MAAQCLNGGAWCCVSEQPRQQRHEAEPGPGPAVTDDAVGEGESDSGFCTRAHNTS